jgi:hypothetical protein
MYGFWYNDGRVEAERSVLSLAAGVLCTGGTGHDMYFAMRIRNWVTPERLSRMFAFIDKHQADGRTDRWICDHSRDMYIEWIMEDEAKKKAKETA